MRHIHIRTFGKSLGSVSLLKFVVAQITDNSLVLSVQAQSMRRNEYQKCRKNGLFFVLVKEYKTSNIHQNSTF